MTIGIVDQVGPEIFRIELPLPTPALKSMNAYVLRDNERSLIIDTGMNRKACLDALENGLKHIGVAFASADIFLTHCHGDHMGMVSRVDGRSKIYLHAAELELLRFFIDLEPLRALWIKHGFPQNRVQSAIDRFPGDRSELAARTRLKFEHLQDGDRLRVGPTTLVVQHTPGHAPGHTCLYAPDHKILFSGDHILEDITPGIQCHSDQADPISAYLASLAKIKKLSLEKILPGHRGMINNPYERIDQLLTHHQRRCDEILGLLRAKASSAYGLATRMKWDIPYASWDDVPDDQKWHATGETIAHLRYLEEHGQVRRGVADHPVVFQLS